MTSVTKFVAIYRDCPKDVPLGLVQMYAAVRSAAHNVGITLKKCDTTRGSNLTLDVPQGTRSCRLDLTIEHESDQEIEPSKELLMRLNLYFRSHSPYYDMQTERPVPERKKEASA